MDEKALQELCQRYMRLYTGAIGDILDKRGYRNQILPHTLNPMTSVNKVAGPAFTGQGYPVGNVNSDDSKMRLKMLESITPYTVSVWACGGSETEAHWGEIMSNAARERGCQGAVVDGGVRDLEFIEKMQFPVFAKFTCSASSIGRWEIKEWQIPIKIGNTVINPGDFVVADIDGVVIVPKDLVMEVLERAEQVYATEGKMREDLRKGVSISKVYEKYGSF